MKLSIIITSWDTKQLLRAYLHSIRSFSPVDSFEIIVVDNASRDFSSDIVEKEFLHVTLVKSAMNTQYGAVTILASRIHSERISYNDRFIGQRKDVDLVSCRFEMPNRELQRSCKTIPTVWSAAAMYCSLHFLNK